LKKLNCEKKPIKLIKILKNQTRPNPNKKTEKKPEPNRKKNLSQTGKTDPNRFEPIFVPKNRTEQKPVSVRFQFLIFFLKKFGLVIFFL